jgi:hypothetical protein
MMVRKIPEGWKQDGDEPREPKEGEYFIKWRIEDEPTVFDKQDDGSFCYIVSTQKITYREITIRGLKCEK